MNLTTSEIQDFLDEPKEFLDERLAMPINNDMASFRASGTHLHIYQENYETAWAYELEDTRIQEFLPDFNPEPILQAIQQDINGTNKVPMFDEFSNMCRFIEHPAIYSNMF